MLVMQLRRLREMELYLVPNEQGIDVVRAYDGPVFPERARTFVDEETVADVLGYMAVDMEIMGCTDSFCPNCNPARAAWWKACNSLSKKTRRGLQALMRDAGVDLPEAPYNEDEPSVVPAAQHG
jgi:hypothetical protein